MHVFAYVGVECGTACVCAEKCIPTEKKQNKTQAVNNPVYVCVVENERELIMEVSSTVSVVQFYQSGRKIH